MPATPKGPFPAPQAGRPSPKLSATVRITVLYSLFAAASIVANLGAQKLFLIMYSGPFAVVISVLFGTAVGLIAKFLLDKTWIFQYKHRDLAHGIQSFILYSVMGVVTTAVFWGFEFGAEAVFGTEAARFTGGAVGLTIGYILKYWLDKRFVFAHPA